jgi:hypothetical protein
MFSCQAYSRLQVLANLPKDVERNGVSMNFPVFVERKLRSSKSLGLSQVETYVSLSWGVINNNFTCNIVCLSLCRVK